MSDLARGCLGDIFLYAKATPQLRLKWNTQRGLRETFSRHLSGTSLRLHKETSWQRLKSIYDDDYPGRERDSVRIWQTYMPKNCKWLVKIKKISNICPKWRQNRQNRVERNLFSLHRVLRLTSYLCLTFLSKAGHCLSPWPGLSSSFRLRSWFNFFFVLQSLNFVKQ